MNLKLSMKRAKSRLRWRYRVPDLLKVHRESLWVCIVQTSQISLMWCLVREARIHKVAKSLQNRLDSVAETRMLHHPWSHSTSLTSTLWNHLKNLRKSDWGKGKLWKMHKFSKDSSHQIWLTEGTVLKVQLWLWESHLHRLPRVSSKERSHLVKAKSKPLRALLEAAC